VTFWNNLPHPVFALAPMEDVTDTVFREIVLSSSSLPEFKLLFTEFTSVDGLMDKRGRNAVAQRLIVQESEQALIKKNGVKLIAQIWGSEPENYFRAIQYIHQHYQFDGIDINMGCPVKKIVKNNACSALINDPVRAGEIIAAAKDASPLPVSVKTRTGFLKHETERWITQLLLFSPAAITLHGRYQRQMSDGKASWDEIKKAVELRNTIAPDIKILGNGDVFSAAQGFELAQFSGVDGLMIGRGIFSNPWFFNMHQEEKSPEEKVKLLIKHVHLFKNLWQRKRNPMILKRFAKVYLNSFAGASELRNNFMQAADYDDMIHLLSQFIPIDQQEANQQ